MGLEVVIFEDMQCGDCARLLALLDSEVRPKFAGRVIFTHRDFPLPKHDWARQAALLAHYFRPQGLESEWRRETLANFRSLRLPEHTENFARRYNLDPAAALAAATDPALESSVEADIAAGKEQGVSKTPTVFIGSTVLVEPQCAQEITAAIEQAL